MTVGSSCEQHPKFKLPLSPQIWQTPPSQVEQMHKQFGVPLKYSACLQSLITKGVLGQEAEIAGWGNVGEHCIKCFHMGQAFCDLLGLDPEAQERLCSEILCHDEGLRIHKEKIGYNSGSYVEDGIRRMRTTKEYFLQVEREYEGIRHVTSMDWRSWNNWSLPQQVMRYVDSCVGPVNGVGRDVFIHWSDRINNLARFKRDMDIAYGEMWYPGYTFPDDGGKPRPSAFAYLMEVVMPGIEQSLFDAIKTANPQTVAGKRSSGLFDIIREKLTESFPENVVQTLYQK